MVNFVFKIQESGTFTNLRQPFFLNSKLPHCRISYSTKLTVIFFVNFFGQQQVDETKQIYFFNDFEQDNLNYFYCFIVMCKMFSQRNDDRKKINNQTN